MLEREDVQKQLLSLMQQEDDYLDLTFQRMAKRIKDNLTPEQGDDLVDEMFLLVSKHIRESKKPKYPPATSTISVATGNNLGMGGGCEMVSLPSPQFHHHVEDANVH